MKSPPGDFEVEYKDHRISVNRVEVDNQVIYRVTIPGEKRILNLTRALNSEGAWFWTSIPEGRQREAQAIGSLIETFIRSIQ